MPSSLNLLLPEPRPFPRVDIRKALAALCEQFGVEALYAFGSLAGEVSAFVQGLGDLERPGASDVDIGALPEPGRLLNPQERVRLIPVPRPDSASGLPRLAASGKDPAFGPATILEEASRSGRYSAEELRELAYAGAPPDASALARRWRSILDEARALVAALPPDEAGTCVLTTNGMLFRGDLPALQDALKKGVLAFHRGRIRGAYPQILPARARAPPAAPGASTDSGADRPYSMKPPLLLHLVPVRGCQKRTFHVLSGADRSCTPYTKVARCLTVLLRRWHRRRRFLHVEKRPAWQDLLRSRPQTREISGSGRRHTECFLLVGPGRSWLASVAHWDLTAGVAAEGRAESVASMDERLAYLEGKVDEQSRGVGELRDAIRHLDQKVGARFGALDQKIDVRADALSARIDALDQKVDRFREELSGRIGALDQKIDAHALALDQKITRYFGLMIGLEAGLLTALFSAFWAYVAR